MKKSLLFLTAIAFMSCDTRNVTISNTDTEIKGCQVQTYVIDSCEYIGNIIFSSFDWATHKGNCKFCAIRKAKGI